MYENWKARFPDLVHWLEAPHREDRVLVPRGSLEPVNGYIVEYDPMSRQTWFRRTRDLSGRPSHISRARTSSTINKRHRRISEYGFTDLQYELIRWAVWKGYKGWRDREIFHIVRHFWVSQPGQTPLVSRSVTQWRLTHHSMKKEGWLWP